jgi:hypothetical protein
MREEGYYFVKFWGAWAIAQWVGDESTVFGWDIIGTDTTFKDDMFDKIGQKIELPKD